MQTLAQGDIRRFFSLSHDLLGVANFSGYFVELSSSWERTLGLTRVEMLAAPYIDFVHPADKDATVAHTSSLADGVHTVYFENRYRCKDGSYRWLEWNATPFRDDGYIYCVARDVTHRKQIETRQSEYEERLRELMGELTPRSSRRLKLEAALLRILQDHLPVCVWVIDQRGVFTHHAGRGLAAVGLKEAEFLGENIFDVYGADPSMVPIRQALAGEFMHSFSENHGSFWETWQIPLTNTHGEVTGVMGISLDVSRAKRAEHELQAKLDLIHRQQQTIHALSVPIIEVWDKVITVPMIGVVDSMRAAELMNNVLSRVVGQKARFVLLDLTGVEMMDTATAAHLLKIVQAMRLIGAEGIITGIQPSVAQTIVALGVDLTSVLTLASLRDGLQHCMKVTRAAA